LPGAALVELPGGGSGLSYGGGAMSGVERTCGSCGLCCKVFPIEELAKAADRWCPHFARGAGCTQYSTRPGACRTFRCIWLTSPGLGEEWKPNVARFVMSERLDDQSLCITVDEGFPQAWRRPPYHEQILSWARQSWKAGRNVIVAVGHSRIVLFPREELAFTVPENAEFKFGYQEGGGVRRPWAQVRSAEGEVTEVLGNPEIGGLTTF
jgi:hypothetical protein